MNWKKTLLTVGAAIGAITIFLFAGLTWFAMLFDDDEELF